MSGLKGRLKQLRVFTHKRRVEQELDEELSIHLEMETEKNIREGMAPGAARRAALVAFGGVERTKERVRDARWTRWVEDLVADVRYAVRTLARAPGFTAAAVLTLAIGIGANTAVFGAVDALFLRQPTGVHDGADVLHLYIVRDTGMVRTPPFGGPGEYGDYETLRHHVPALSAVAAFTTEREMDLGLGAHARRIRGREVSRSFFPLLGVRMALGRAFASGEVATGGRPAAIISYGLWQRQFGGDRDVLGRPLLLDGRTRTVIGVTERGFTGIAPDALDVWVPLVASAHPYYQTVNLIGRRAPHASLSLLRAQVTAELTREARTVPHLDPTPHVALAGLVPAYGPYRSNTYDLALWLWAVAGMILVIGCANVANLLLARSTRRRREMASRLALGASPGRLARQVLTESMVLAALGAAAGLVLALSVSSVMQRFPIPPGAAALNGRLLGLAALLAVVAGTAPGLAPALGAARSQPNRWLGTTQSTSPSRRGRTRATLVVVQVALSAILLVGAGLFLRSLSKVYEVDPGVDTSRLLVASIDLEQAGYAAQDGEAIYADAEERLRHIPGVQDVAVARNAPLGFIPDAAVFYLAGHSSPWFVDEDWVGPRYFRTVGAPVLRGRGIRRTDGMSPPVAVVNQTAARELARDGDPIGMCLDAGAVVGKKEKGCQRVVGVVRNQRSFYLQADVKPTMYIPRAEALKGPAFERTYLVVRVHDPRALLGPVREALQTLRPDLPYVSVQTLEERIAPELESFRLGAALFSVFGLLALAIAALGLYSVVSYSVSERAPELGIRRSLGAEDRDVLRLVIRQSAVTVTVGIVLGLAAAYAGGRAVQALLFGVSGRDPAVFAVAAVFLAAVALVASWVPAKRATAVDPMDVLRAE